MNKSAESQQDLNSVNKSGAPLTSTQLPDLLTRMAALQGHAVPAYRFRMTETNGDGVLISSLSVAQQAEELWRGQFPVAEVTKITPQQIERGQFPLLWISSAKENIHLLRGKLSNGNCTVEEETGKVKEISMRDLSHGVLLSLKPTIHSPSATGAGARSAGDWFVYSIRQYRSVFMEAVLATFVVSVLGLVGALYSMQVYDRVVPSKGYSTLIVLSVGALLGIGLELIIKQVRAHMIDRACKAIDQELSAVFFNKALQIRLDAQPKTVGTFASQIRYFESVRNFLTASSLFVLADTPFAIFFIIIIATISLPVALVPIVLLPFAYLIGLFLRKPIETLSSAHMQESNRKNGLLIEAIDGIESIKAANAEWKLLERWRTLTHTISLNELKLKELTNFSSNITQTLQQLIYILMVAVGAYEITLGQLSMGGLIACTIISGRALSPFSQIPSLIVQWKQAQIALKSLDAIMALPNDRPENQRLLVPEKASGHLELKNAVFAYGPEQTALQIENLTINPGERIAIVGSIGSGKSTLLKILTGLYKPQQGTLEFDHLDITHLAPEFVREHIGYLPQDVRLYQGTLRDNLTLGLPSPSDSQILRAASLTGLDQVIKRHPKGLELEITEGGRGLSGGQRQLVGLTRLLLQQPRIMLLDEPTASMDAQIEARVMEHLFKEISPTSSLIVVTHKTAVLAHITRLMVIDQGRVVLDGPKDQVLARLQTASQMAMASQITKTTGITGETATQKGQE